MVRLVPVSVVAREGRFSGVLISKEEEVDRSVAMPIVVLCSLQVVVYGNVGG